MKGRILIMMKKIVKFITGNMDSVNTVEDQIRAHSTEIVGRKGKENVIINVTIQTFPNLPKDKGGIRLTKQGKLKYDMTKEEEKFVKECYCNRHLDARQISKLTGIYQPSLFTFIRQKKLKPIHDKTMTKTERNISFDTVDEYLK